jgi:hypothetical protein
MDDHARSTATCFKCKRTLPLTHEYWHYHRGRPNGFQACCRECQNNGPGAWKNRDKAAYALRQRQYHVALRYKVLSQYCQGVPRCACCGEQHIEFLTIDHINGGGHRHRAKIGRNSAAILRWLQRQGYPEGFAVLCYNCNCAKAYHGRCPHDADRTGQAS